MSFEFLSQNEQNALHLEELYSGFGYTKYKVNRFEEYSFYMENESFLMDRRVLTFSGANGKLFALKPDVTTSVVKNAKGSQEETQKIYYNESVFRIPKGGDEFREIHQTGIEFIGTVDSYHTTEVLFLAMKSLEKISAEHKLCISNTALLLIFMNKLNLKSKDRKEIIHYLKQKNTHDLMRYLNQRNIDDEGFFAQLLAVPSEVTQGMAALEKLFSDWEYENELKEFKQTVEQLVSVVKPEEVYLDFSHIPSTEYYKGLVFAGYLNGLAEPALTGGRYDNLLEKMGIYNRSALGFAVDLSATHSLYGGETKEVLVQKYQASDSVKDLILAANRLYEDGKTFRFTT